MPPAETVNLLWTAGYDSTFRLLSLLAAGRTVRPLYVVDHDRPSFPHELRRMAELRRLIEAWPGSAGRLLPLDVRLRADFPVAPDIRAAFEAVAAEAHVGSQYPWLAQVCRDLGFGTGAVELCMVRHEPPTPLQRAIFADPHALPPRLRTDAARVLFAAYSFPTLGLGKADIRAEAARAGFTAILERTWFCHRPVLGRPCGRCAPCRIARTERPGLDYSRWGRLRALGSRGRHLLSRAGLR
jgi:hypothetical protein